MTTHAIIRNPSAGLSGRSASLLSYLALYRASPMERITIIKKGVPATEAKRLIGELSLATGQTLRALNLSQATVNKRAKNHESLTADESERVIGIAKLIGQVEAMVQESGNPEGFSATNWLSSWLNQPLAALSGARPIDLLDTMEGQDLVSSVLAKMQSGAYA